MEAEGFLDGAVFALSGLLPTVEAETLKSQSFGLPIFNVLTQVGALADLAEKKTIQF